MSQDNASAASCHQGYWAYYMRRMKEDASSFGVEVRIPRGFGLYPCSKPLRLLPGEPHLDVINRALVRLGYDAVARRTFGNYRKNWMHGNHPRAYVPVNRTDYGVPAGPSDVPPEFVDRGRAA